MAFFPELQYNAPKINTPFENALPLAQLQQAASQNKLSEIKFQKAERDTAQENMLAGAYRDSYGADGKQDRNKLYSAIAAGGGGHLLAGIQKGYNEADASGAELDNKRRTGEKLQLENDQSNAEAAARNVSTLAADPTLSQQLVHQKIDQMVAQKHMTPEDADSMKRMVPQDVPGIQKFLGSIYQSLLNPKEQADIGLKERDYRQKAAQDPFNADGSPNTAVQNYGIQKATAGAQQGYTAPVAGMQNGNPVFFQPSKGGGAPSVVQGITPPSTKTPKLSPTALKMQQESLDAIGISSGINTDLGSIKSQIDTGKLNLGTLDNQVSKLRNWSGNSSENSRNYGTFTSTLEKLRNDSLRLNKGVQTEGDAVRSWNEVFSNLNDNDMVSKRLGEIQLINQRATNLHKMNIDAIRSNFGIDPMDTSKYENQPPVITKPANNPDPKAAGAYLSGAKNQADFAARVKALKAKGWTDQQIMHANGE